MSGSGDLQPNSGLRYHTDADSPLPETINPIIDAVEANSADYIDLLSGGSIYNLALMNGWTGTLHMSKNKLGQVRLTLDAVSGTGDVLTQIAIVPVELRPKVELSVPVIIRSLARTRFLNIRPTGAIRISQDESIPEAFSVHGEFIYYDV